MVFRGSVGYALLLIGMSVFFIREEARRLVEFVLVKSDELDRSAVSNFTNMLNQNAFQWNSTTSASASAIADNNATNTTFIDSKEESFAGCLLVMDDNFRLSEWLAYHYHVLPLRYLVVAVDPRSRYSPEPIIQLFRQHLNMTILSWNDTDFGNWDSQPKDPNSWNELRGRYLKRQTVFLKKCMVHLKQQNQGWTMLWDTDEYIVFTNYNQTRTVSETGRNGTSPASLKEPGSVLRYMQNVGANACFPVYRTYIGAKETDPAILATEIYPPVLNDTRRLDTLRFRFRNDFKSKLNGQSKCMLDVRHVNTSFEFRSPHYPAPYLSCPSGYLLKDSAVYLHHYISSWEAYSFRDDSRKGRERSIEAYTDRAQVTSMFYDDSITSWLGGFVDDVGEETASILLQDAGLPLEYNATDKIKDFGCVVGKRCKPGGKVPPTLP